MPALLELNLYFNRISTFPARLPGRPRGLLKLRRLTLSQVRSAVSYDWNALCTRHGLILLQNAFASLPEDLFEGMTDLAHLDCWENLLTGLPGSLAQCMGRLSLFFFFFLLLTSSQARG